MTSKFFQTVGLSLVFSAFAMIASPINCDAKNTHGDAPVCCCTDGAGCACWSDENGCGDCDCGNTKN